MGSLADYDRLVRTYSLALAAERLFDKNPDLTNALLLDEGERYLRRYAERCGMSATERDVFGWAERRVALYGLNCERGWA